MKFESKYLGKWVAIKDNKVIASDTTLTKLSKKLKAEDSSKLRYTLIPRNLIAG